MREDFLSLDNATGIVGRANAFEKQRPGCSFSIGLNWEKQQI
jgi:hypothetical protein